MENRAGYAIFIGTAPREGAVAILERRGQYEMYKNKPIKCPDFKDFWSGWDWPRALHRPAISS